MTSNFTRHAIARMTQRAIRSEDVDLIIAIGTEIENGYLVRTKDCQEALRELKRLLHQVRRLEGKRIVTAGERIVTTYLARPKTLRRLLRGAEERELG
jgi:hypothetical protein